MLLTISTTHHPATDLGFLLHKHPQRVQTTKLSFGAATVGYPEATEEKCTAALFLDIDQVDLVRGRRDASREAVTLGQYVNDRPYAATSFLSSAIGKCFGTALGGRSKERSELADTPIPLVAHLTSVPCRGGEALLRRLFAPLGYIIESESIGLDSTMPSWGASQYFNVTLTGVLKVKDLLEHLYVLIPVLDNAKHYWVGDEEVDRIVRRGGSWLATHPDRELISTRALRYDRKRARETLLRLAALDNAGAEVDPDWADRKANNAEEVVEAKISLNNQRMDAVVRELRQLSAIRVADLGCGEGRLVGQVLKEVSSVEKIIGVDVSIRSLQRATKRLHFDTMSPSMRKRVDLIQGALTYKDKRLAGCDTVTLIEVIEHVDKPRLDALERATFVGIAPRNLIVTTPNIEYNVLFESLGDSLRHRDHRFEWTRAEFSEWAESVALRNGYTVRYEPIGPVHEIHGPPTQMAIFTRSFPMTAQL
jgi:3' terminal RNA ribose 2'-O-methyltransferase Hen1